MDPRETARRFLSALASNDQSAYAAVLSEDAGVRIWGWNGSRVFRPRERVIALLVSEWEALHDPTFETLSVLVEGDRVAVEFRIYAMEGGRIVEYNRAAFLTIAGNHVQTADLYYAEPQPSARRTPWKASATLTEAELEQLFDSLYYTFDVRTWLPPIIARRMNLRELTGGTGDPHPSGSFIGEVHWSAEETDAKIAAIIEDHRRRNAGFMWQVRSSSTPAEMRRLWPVSA